MYCMYYVQYIAAERVKKFAGHEQMEGRKKRKKVWWVTTMTMLW